MAEPWLISKSIDIHSDPERVWSVLTEPASIKQWLSDSDLEVTADWVVGGAITTSGDWHGLSIENKGKVVALEAGRLLAYKQWNSLSQIPDRDENYSLIRFELVDTDAGVSLALSQENFLTYEIYAHWNFYWNMALHRIKQLSEIGHL